MAAAYWIDRSKRSRPPPRRPLASAGHWPKVLAGLLAIGLAALVAREIPPAIRYIKMERMLLRVSTPAA
jgi:hypothetical protein